MIYKENVFKHDWCITNLKSSFTEQVMLIHNYSLSTAHLRRNRLILNETGEVRNGRRLHGMYGISIKAYTRISIIVPVTLSLVHILFIQYVSDLNCRQLKTPFGTPLFFFREKIKKANMQYYIEIEMYKI